MPNPNPDPSPTPTPSPTPKVLRVEADGNVYNVHVRTGGAEQPEVTLHARYVVWAAGEFQYPTPSPNPSANPNPNSCPNPNPNQANSSTHATRRRPWWAPS